jgi:hypothetical protein
MTVSRRSWLCGRARWRVTDGWRATSPEHPADDLPDPQKRINPGKKNERRMLAARLQFSRRP